MERVKLTTTEDAVVITMDELVHAEAEVLTGMTMEKPFLLLIKDEMSTFAARLAEKLFNVEKEEEK